MNLLYLTIQWSNAVFQQFMVLFIQIYMSILIILEIIIKSSLFINTIIYTSYKVKKQSAL